MDFPRAWQIAKEVPFAEHEKGCSYRIARGGFLCDCKVLWGHPEYGKDKTEQEKRDT